MKTVLVNGCFDCLHIGHVRFLQAARKRGDSLVVAIDADERVRELKGAGRPVVNEDDRRAMLSSLRCVDRVLMFYKSPMVAIRAIHPDVLVRGFDQIDTEEEVAFMRQRGGVIVHESRLADVSTTDLIERMRR